ncbi:Dipeptide transport system permease protein DppC [Labilithrix luteola]|uniref:Dipeptide transport system permease protein DppC n=1 Tax=Labilithrix luteola TaxID=1391654 RepID=A0A0K1QBB8_9BACT|nr:ABC transporter permease [Labilithrix luteola]AKV03081.1 Dipeptide transport system permease protein DppC [Labilithrix luteola]
MLVPPIRTTKRALPGSRNRAAVVGSAIVAAILLFAVFGPLLVTKDPNASDFARGISPDHLPVGPSSAFPLGTDRLFRDQLSRLAVGARVSLFIGIAATVVASVVGAVVGIVAGWFEGQTIDTVLMRIVDVGLAFPFLLIVMALGAALDRTTSTTIFLTLGLTGWLGTARVLRAKTLQIRHHDFVTAARALGQSTPRILLRHVLPNVMGPLVVVSTVSVAQMILAESVLSYLGAGIAPPTPTWGHMLFDGQDYITTSPWIAVAPGAAIMLSVLGFNLLGEGLRDALDPQKH